MRTMVKLNVTDLLAGEGAEYVRLVFGTAGGAATEVDDPSNVIDAEFLFLAGVYSDPGTAAIICEQAGAEGLSTR